MSDPFAIPLLILGLPLAAALIAAVLAATPWKTFANWPLVAACAVSAVLALLLLERVADEPGYQYFSRPVTWFA